MEEQWLPFLQKKGGRIYLGVNKNNFPVGINWNQEVKDRISQVARNCAPSACISINDIKHDSEKSIICVTIDKGNGSIHTYKKVGYERRQGINHPLTPDEMLEIQKRNKKIYFDGMLAKSEDRPGLITDLDEEKVKQFLIKSKGRLRNEFNLKQFLINSELSINGSGKVKNAAILLFGKKPSHFIPQNKIKISIFTGDEIANEFIKTEVAGTIEEIYRNAFIVVQRNLKNYSFIRGSERIEVPEYPPEAIREAIINSIVHRDYFSDSTEIFIKVFKSRIEITNPGGFPFAGHSWEEVERSGLSIRRNPLIAEFLEKINLMEKEGHGIRRIKSVMEKHGLTGPSIETTQNTFKLTLYGIGDDDAKKIAVSPFGTVMDSSQLNVRQENMLDFIKSHPGSSRNDCCKGLDLPPRTVARDLRHLLSNNFLVKLGKGKGTKYNAR